MLARFFVPAGAVALVLLAVAWAWDRRQPLENSNVTESVIVTAQIERARTIPPADVLILGDSSALMGVDAGELGRLLGRRVESLATLAWVGPAGYARLIDEYAARHPLATLILLFHPGSLDITEAAFEINGYEREVLGMPRRAGRSLFDAARYSLYVHTLMRAIVLPLPGVYGKEYGWPDGLAARLRDHHGSLVDPNVLKEEVPPLFAIDPPFAARLPALRDAIVAAKPGHVYLALTPIAATRLGPEIVADRLAVSTKLATRLGLSPGDALIPLPPSFPKELFATWTHLSAAGQTRYTEELSALLEPRLGKAAVVPSRVR